MILPAALRYQTEIADSLGKVKALGLSVDTAPLDELGKLIGELKRTSAALESASSHNGAHDVLAEAKHGRDKILPAMLAVRSVADQLEAVVADDLWPLPTYQEMLFVR
jgi:glutamine synthetase